MLFYLLNSKHLQQMKYNLFCFELLLFLNPVEIVFMHISAKRQQMDSGNTEEKVKRGILILCFASPKHHMS